MGRSKRQAAKAAEKPRRRRNSKADVEQMLQNLFMGNPQTTFKLKDIFRELRLNTHPLKMLTLSVLDEMTWDDFLKKEGDNAFRLNMGGQVQEGRFVRKLNGKNSIVPDGTVKNPVAYLRHACFPSSVLFPAASQLATPIRCLWHHQKTPSPLLGGLEGGSHKNEWLNHLIYFILNEKERPGREVRTLVFLME